MLATVMHAMMIREPTYTPSAEPYQNRRDECRWFYHEALRPCFDDGSLRIRGLLHVQHALSELHCHPFPSNDSRERKTTLMTTSFTRLD